MIQIRVYVKFSLRYLFNYFRCSNIEKMYCMKHLFLFTFWRSFSFSLSKNTFSRGFQNLLFIGNMFTHQKNSYRRTNQNCSKNIKKKTLDSIVYFELFSIQILHGQNHTIKNNLCTLLVFIRNFLTVK